MRLRFTLLFALLPAATLTWACSSDDAAAHKSQAITPEDASTVDISEPDAALGGGVVACSGAHARFPRFDRACWEAEWCSVAVHQTDCCGNRTATGIASKLEAVFKQAEQSCRAEFPACGCAAGPIRTDTGQTATDETLVKVDCRQGVCTTYVP